MQPVIQSYLTEAGLGHEQSYRNLTMFPLISVHQTTLDYINLDEAFTKGLIEVAEVSEEGSVPHLKVENNSPEMMLILDGEELVGAKQNRIVNTTILLQGDSSTTIPVSCVEQGRWSYRSSKFHSQKRMMAAQLRAVKVQHVKAATGFRSDQGAIWNGIAEKATRMEAESPTGAMAEIYEKERSSLADYVGHFQCIESQVGAVFLINRKVAGLECFGKPETFAKVFGKLVESYALDAIDYWSGQSSFPFHSQVGNGRGQAVQFLQAVNQAHTESHPSVGLGMDCRLTGGVNGFALIHSEQILHLSVFAGNGGPESHRS
jgi:hypothetical protein